ncbi:hypothetical protein [Bailinhaonella thermotolerans]|uniref:Uncharacterized protein n=1 Tax=Bailinhaonella thermotolerans TaxID=1070861 RepID=A0A3A3ZZC5_9ACTN|nr:hypothetical protein [Bailinhaonella thermotolerans]RJL21039.1 hypothetical protein D5H75_38140 [Bailinhaonella thermotolerans]
MPLTVTPDPTLRGEALYRAALKHIARHPDAWDQYVYRVEKESGVAMCLAGWAATLAGGTWADLDFYGRVWLHAEPEDDPHDIAEAGDLRLVNVHERARRLLGLTATQAEQAFSGWNTWEDLAHLADAYYGPSRTARD